MGELRKDPLTGRQVIIAAGRAERPRPLGHGGAEATEPCPFCAGHEAETPPEVWSDRPAGSPADRPGWNVRVVPNKYPALTRDGSGKESQASGVHEVIIESPAHLTQIGQFSTEQFNTILHAYRSRLAALRNDHRLRYALVYKNQGADAGATLPHVHSQLLALPFLPESVATELQGAKQFFAANQRCYFCALMDGTVEDGGRYVTANQDFAALCPDTPRFAFETWILPKIHWSCFDQCHDSALANLAQIMREVLRRLGRIQDNPPFNYFIHTLPLGEAAAPHYHWHIEILPQIGRAAGFEWGTGVHINAVAPEHAAQRLRDAVI
jgi:UDPglucose--hexose-1-phosphate uridylyltransferase